MPFSHFYQINEIIKLIVFTNPQSLLDVGVGFGMYGYLARLYLELSDGREKYDDWRRRIEGIEVYEKYISPVHQYVYDEIYIGDATELLMKIEKKYDLVLLIDIIEHFEHEQGMNLIKLAMKRGRNVLISTPNQFWDQKSAFGNPYETHRSVWSRKNFASFKQKLIIRNEYSLICYLGEDAPRIKRFLLKRRIYGYRDRIKSCFFSMTKAES